MQRPAGQIFNPEIVTPSCNQAGRRAHGSRLSQAQETTGRLGFPRSASQAGVAGRSLTFKRNTEHITVPKSQFHASPAISAQKAFGGEGEKSGEPDVDLRNKFFDPRKSVSFVVEPMFLGIFSK